VSDASGNIAVLCLFGLVLFVTIKIFDIEAHTRYENTQIRQEFMKSCEESMPMFRCMKTWREMGYALE
jgi:hypothetical protein